MVCILPNYITQEIQPSYLYSVIAKKGLRKVKRRERSYTKSPSNQLKRIVFHIIVVVVVLVENRIM